MAEIIFDKIDNSKLYKVNKKGYYRIERRDGKVYKFDNYKGLIKWVLQNIPNLKLIGSSWKDRATGEGLYELGYVFKPHKSIPISFIVFDIDDRIICPNIIEDDVDKLILPKKDIIHINYHIPKKFDPYFRRPRTTQELRRNSWDIEYARAKRCKKLLPSSYDDLPIRSRKVKSWKKQKIRKRWMSLK